MNKIFYSPDDSGGSSPAPVSAPVSASAPAVSTPASTPAVSAPVSTPKASAPSSSTTTASKSQPSSVSSKSKAPALGTPEKFDASKWDGNVDSLPESSREYARLAADRVTTSLQAQIDEARKAGMGNSEAMKELQKELDVYKLLSEGLEDPRVGTLTDRLKEIESSSKTWQEKHAAMESQLRSYQDAEDQKWVNDFKEKHSSLLSDKAKSTQFFSLCDGGWEEEAATQLVAGTPELLKEAESIVNRFKLGPDGHVFAIQHARMKLGIDIAPRVPRVAATITNGSQGGVKTASRVGGGSVRDLPRDQARREAASLALRLVKK